MRVSVSRVPAGPVPPTSGASRVADTEVKMCRKSCDQVHWEHHAGASQVIGGNVEERPMAHVLVLNATFEPLCLVPQRRAVVLLLAQKAILVEGDDGAWHSQRETVTPPVVVRLAKFVRVPYRGTVPLTRRAEPGGAA